jgi:hypothetical protein
LSRRNFCDRSWEFLTKFKFSVSCHNLFRLLILIISRFLIQWIKYQRFGRRVLPFCKLLLNPLLMVSFQSLFPAQNDTMFLLFLLDHKFPSLLFVQLLFTLLLLDLFISLFDVFDPVIKVIFYLCSFLHDDLVRVKPLLGHTLL